MATINLNIKTAHGYLSLQPDGRFALRDEPAREDLPQHGVDRLPDMPCSGQRMTWARPLIL